MTEACPHTSWLRVQQCTGCGNVRPYEWGKPRAEIVVVDKATLAERVITAAEFRALEIVPEIYIEFRPCRTS